MIVRVNGSKLFISDRGPRDGRAVIFIHAFPLDHRMWLRQMAALEESYRVIAYDSRGLGASDVGDGQYTMEMLSDDLVGVMDALGVEKAAWCGISLGGYVALRAFEKNPARCSALMLCDTRCEADANEAKIKRANAIAAIKSQGLAAYAETFLKGVLMPESIARQSEAYHTVRDTVLAQNPLGVCGVQLALGMRTDTTASLERIRVPTLIVVGDKDATTPVAAAQALQRGIAGAELVVIPDAAHLSNLERPEEFNRTITRFLARL